MPSLRQLIEKQPLRVIRPWAIEADLPSARTGRKAQIVEELLAAPDAIPQDVRSQAELPPPGAALRGSNRTGSPHNPAGPHGPQPPLPGPPAGSQPILDVASIADAVLARLTPQLANLQTQIDSLRQIPPGESILNETLPIPSTAPTETAAARALGFHPSVPPTVLEAVLENRLDVKDLWKLDPVRAEEVAAVSKQPDAARALAESLFPDHDAQVTKTRSKYPTIGSIVRPWVIFCQIRDLVQPGACRYMLCHASDLLRLQHQFPNSLAPTLSYHLFVVAKRLNLGAAFPLEAWQQIDGDALQSHFYPGVHRSQSTSAGTSASHPPSYQPTAAPQWSASSQGNQSSQHLCKNFNNRLACARSPCPFRHACASCNGEGHCLRDCTENASPPSRPNSCPTLFDPCGPSPAPLGGSLQPAVDSWEAALSSYPDPAFPRLISRLIRNGATLGAPPNAGPAHIPPYRLAARERSFLSEETQRRLLAGEVQVASTSPRFVSPLSAVPKDQTKLRAIHDLCALNDHVPPGAGSLTYSSVDDFLPAIAALPHGAFLWKVDLSNAFRHIRLAPSSQPLAGFELDGVRYVDLCLPFGSTVAPLIFNLLAEAFHWILLKCGVPHVQHYLDDFFGVAASYNKASAAVNMVHLTASCLGLRINKSKCFGPSTIVPVLGIELDTARWCARLDQERVSRTLDEIGATLLRKTVTRRELEHLVGLLGFACTVIPVGRPFLRRLWSAITDLPLHLPSGSRRRLSSQASLDLAWWVTLLRDWNGRRPISEPARPRLDIWTDASGTKGAGGHLGHSSSASQAFAYVFPRRHRDKDIVFKELHAVIYAVEHLSASGWSGSHLTFHVDNQAVVAALSSGTIRMESAQALLRRLWLLAARGGFSFSSLWLASAENSSQLSSRSSQQSGDLAGRRAPAAFALLAGPSLSASATYFLYNGIGEGTRKGYEVAQKSFTSWASRTGILRPFSATATNICNWIADLATSGHRPGTIRGCMSGLRSLHTDCNLGHVAFDNPQVDRVFRGIRRAVGEVSRRRRLPITLPVLAAILSALRTVRIADNDRAALAAAFALAYVGGLRCGKITYDAFDPAFHISVSDVSDFGSYATVRLPASKTDPFRRGVLIVVPAAPPGSPVDPLDLLRIHLAARPPGQGPLFSKGCNRLNRVQPASFPRSFFVDTLRLCLTRAGLTATDYAGHSFRRGMATWAKLEAQMDDGDIKLLGRWSSDAVKLYQETPTAQLAALARRTLARGRTPHPGIVPASLCWWGDE